MCHIPTMHLVGRGYLQRLWIAAAYHPGSRGPTVPIVPIFCMNTAPPNLKPPFSLLCPVGSSNTVTQ